MVFAHQCSCFENGIIFNREPVYTSEDRCHLHIAITVSNCPNSNRTCIALNLPLTRVESKVRQHQDSQPISVSRDKRNMSNTTKNDRGRLRLRWVCLGVKVGFELLSERDQGGVGTNVTRESKQ